MTIDSFLPQRYDTLLENKAENISQLFSGFDFPGVTIFPSEKQHFRMRAEFRIWHEGAILQYAMFDPVKKTPYFLDYFPLASRKINELMPSLLELVSQKNILSKRLFQVEFLTTTTGASLITLIYHRPLDEQWLLAAKALEQQLGTHIIGRSRKQRLIVSEEFVTERFAIGGRHFTYRQYENSFTQPNAGINAKMLAWAEEVSLASCDNRKADLVELYCGNGNFTCVLASNFNQVLANEISKVSVNAARYNLEHNGIDNVEIVRMSSEELSQAMKGIRKFRRLEHLDLKKYQFNTVFVDPPRAGLDPATLKEAQRFNNIIYISCNHETLYDNMKTLTQTHQAEHFALFDQFPYTGHAECGVFLKRK